MSNELPWQIWTPDDLVPPLAEFVPMEHRDEPIAIDDEPELSAEQQLEQQLAQLKMQAHEQGSPKAARKATNRAIRKD